MNDFISLINGKFDNKISVIDRGLSYGDGFFETMKWVSEKQKNQEFFGVAFWNRHLKRIIKTSNALCFNMPPTEVLIKFRQKLLKRASTIGFRNGPLKIIITRGLGQRGYKFDKDIQPTIIFLAFNSKPVNTKNSYHRARFCNTKMSVNEALSGFKHLNRLDSVMARAEWNDSEIYEGIFLDKRKNILEGTMSNVFFVKDNTLFTPKISDSGINGIMREVIIEKGKNFYDSVKIVDINKNEVKNFSEMFVTNSLINLVSIKKLEKVEFKISQRTKKLKSFLDYLKNCEVS